MTPCNFKMFQIMNYQILLMPLLKFHYYISALSLFLRICHLAMVDPIPATRDTACIFSPSLVTINVSLVLV